MSSTVLLVITSIVGLYMAWNIGANDVANAMGTSVGSKALTLRRALLLAGLLEFAGAVLVGAHVTDTVRKGIVDASIFAVDPNALIYGMLSALAGAALWLNLATHLGWPVSTTHSIVGAVAGFGLVFAGPAAIKWSKMGTIVASWVVSPLTSGVLAYAIYRVVRIVALEREDPKRGAWRAAPYIVSIMSFVLTLVLLFKGLKNLKLQLLWWQSLGSALALGLVAALVTRFVIWRTPPEDDARFHGVERIFAPLQVITAGFVAFAHGANDVANSVGPVAAVLATIESGVTEHSVGVPMWVLVGGGVGIVLGLATYGYRVMATIGNKITEITPSRGFASEFGAAMTILVGSKLGLPLSTTHTLVGAVIGVGFARGIRAINMAVVRNIVVSWLLTIPFAAAVTALLYALMRAVF